MTQIPNPDVGIDTYQHFTDAAMTHAQLCTQMRKHINAAQEILRQNEEDDLVVSYEEVAEHLGEILFSMSVISKKMGIPLSDLARANLFKHNITTTQIEDLYDQDRLFT